jgi:hypothetical protein
MRCSFSASVVIASRPHSENGDSGEQSRSVGTETGDSWD